MVLAVHYDDRTSFDAIWKWTHLTLQIRNDKLFAWHWSPKDGVSDENNATDGDIYIAWALLRAHGKWHEDSYRNEALQILASVREKLLRKDKRGTLLLPGAQGFDNAEDLTLNLSYWIFPALNEFKQAIPDPIWDELSQTGINLLLESHFGRWGLPPDWLKVGDKLETATGFPARFSYDAVRIPLYLRWSGRDTNALLKPFRDYWEYFTGARFVPAWTNLGDNSIDSWDASTGIRAIAAISTDQHASVVLPMLDDKQDYFSSTLLLLTKLMLRETQL